jgi:hypothetical protein
MTNFEKVRRYKVAAKLDEAERSFRSLNLFLAGPFVDVGKPHTDATNNSSAAKSLRHWLYHEFEKRGHIVYLGEDVLMRLNGEANFGGLANAVVYERHHILKHNDAVIVLPDSPGSFCEIGDWVSDKAICENMLLIVDKQHEGEVNYVNEGIVRFARSNGALVEYMDYKDHPEVLKRCEGFVAEVVQKIELEELYGRR